MFSELNSVDIRCKMKVVWAMVECEHLYVESQQSSGRKKQFLKTEINVIVDFKKNKHSTTTK
jgi:hypothetical protein